MSNTPRIYVACLASYNNGDLHGVWIDLDDGDADRVNKEIKAMLASSPTPGAEEYAIHDYEGFGGMRVDEYTPVDWLVGVAGLASDHDFEALASFIGWHGINETGDPSDISKWFEEAFIGYMSVEDFACDYLVEAYPDIVNGPLGSYIDYAAYGRDLVLGGDVYSTADHNDKAGYLFWGA